MVGEVAVTDRVGGMSVVVEAVRWAGIDEREVRVNVCGATGGEGSLGALLWPRVNKASAQREVSDLGRPSRSVKREGRPYPRPGGGGRWHSQGYRGTPAEET